MTAFTVEMVSKISLPATVVQFEAPGNKDLWSIQFAPETAACPKRCVYQGATAFCVLDATEFTCVQRMFPDANIKASITIDYQPASAQSASHKILGITLAGGRLTLDFPTQRANLEFRRVASEHHRELGEVCRELGEACREAGEACCEADDVSRDAGDICHETLDGGANDVKCKAAQKAPTILIRFEAGEGCSCNCKDDE